MKVSIRRILLFLAALLLAACSVLPALGEGSVTPDSLNPEDVEDVILEKPLLSVPLPIDFTGGAVPNEQCYPDEYTYEDPTISVKITFRDSLADYVPDNRKKAKAGGAWIVDIRIGDISQLRTAAAVSFQEDSSATVQEMAERVNAVIAFNGDFATRLKNEGIIIRQGVTFKNKLKGKRDALLIDEDGNFHVFTRPKKDEISDTVDGKKIINAFYFGPVLVDNGVIPDKFTTFQYLHENDYYARLAICQVGPLHYKMIVTTMQDVTLGLPLKAFAQLCKDEGAICAFNLDGGYSATLFFRGEQINSTKKAEPRKVPDIVYFASSWNGEEGQ